MILSLVLVIACGGDPKDTATPDTATDESGDADSATDTGSGPIPTYAEVETEVFMTCAGCHYGQPAGLGFVDAYDSLVNVASTQAPEMVRVAPGDLDNSYLWRKLEGTHGEVGSGERMPKDGTLPAASRELVRAWIAGGAPR